MTIYKLDKVHEMNVCLTNVGKEFHLSSVRGNKQTNFLESLKMLHKNSLVHPCTISIFVMYT